MPGPANSTNKFGPSSYVVGTTLGDGCNFNSIQAAINQAVADGFGIASPTTVIIRSGAYNENIVLTDGGIALQGTHDGVLGQFTVILGDITCTVTGANGFSFSDLSVTNSAGPALSGGGGPNPILLAARNCTFTSTNPGSPAVEINVASGTFGFSQFENCTLNGDSSSASSLGRTVMVFQNCRLSGNTDGIFLDGSSRAQLSYSTLTAVAGAGIFFNAAANQCTCSYSFITSANAIVDMTAGGASNLYKCVLNSADPSANFVIGSGNLDYGDLINQGVIELDPAIGAITVNDWKPYGEAGAVPGTGVTKGTACYSSVDFVVTNGFVEILGSSSGAITQINADTGTTTPVAGNINIFGGPGVRTTGIGDTLSITSVEFNDVAAPIGLATDTGYFSSGAIVLTLPAVAGQGELIEIYCVTAGAIVTANVGQTIGVGSGISAVGGTATSLAVGDSLILRYNAANARWCALSAMGSWTVV